LDTVDNLIELLYPAEYGAFPDLKMAIYEGLSNAAEHGNAKKADKKIYFRIELKMDKILVKIKDEGEGFDWSQKLMGFTNTQATHKGLGLINHLMDEVSFSIQGNEINMLKILE
jgi:serine/threonine-protein kinase RsbW